MGKKRSVVYGLGTTRSQHWGQWIGGTVREQEWRQRPEAGQGRVRSKSACLPVGLLLLLLSLGLFSFLPDAAAGDDDGCLLAAINPVDTPVHGDAFLCIDAKGVRARLHAKGLGTETRTPSGFSTGTTLPNVPLQASVLRETRSSRPV